LCRPLCRRNFLSNALACLEVPETMGYDNLTKKRHCSNGNAVTRANTLKWRIAMDLEQYRQVIQDAIQSEIDAKTFYEDVSKGIKDNSLKDLFLNFSKEEAKHEQILTRVLNQEKITTAHFNCDKDFKVAETVDMPDVTPDMDLKSAIALAMKNEEVAMKKYTALAGNCKDPELKQVFLDLAAMERDHKFKMEENFVDVAYPEVW
jgi:rubrerythrin